MKYSLPLANQQVTNEFLQKACLFFAKLHVFTWCGMQHRVMCRWQKGHGGVKHILWCQLSIAVSVCRRQTILTPQIAFLGLQREAQDVYPCYLSVQDFSFVVSINTTLSRDALVAAASCAQSCDLYHFLEAPRNGLRKNNRCQDSEQNSDLPPVKL